MSLVNIINVELLDNPATRADCLAECSALLLAGVDTGRDSYVLGLLQPLGNFDKLPGAEDIAAQLKQLLFHVVARQRPEIVGAVLRAGGRELVTAKNQRGCSCL